jgi:hypothetical protein
MEGGNLSQPAGSEEPTAGTQEPPESNVNVTSESIVDVSSPERAESETSTTPGKEVQNSPLVRVGNFLGASWIFIVGGLVWLYNADISPGLRTFIVVAVAVLMVGGVLAWVAWALRLKPGVRKATAVVFLVGLVLLTALAPVVFLGESDRILLLKLGAIGFLALFPGLLYLQFVSAKGETLRMEYVLNLHKLQMDTYWNLPPPPRGSLFWKPGDDRDPDDKDNLYLQKFDAIFGVRVQHGEGEKKIIHRSGGSLLPIGLCTVLLAVGWALTLQPEPIVTNQLIQSVTLSGRPLLPVDPLRFGFLGAYFFIIEMLTRRYFQDDLKTGAYLNGATRILSTTILITSLHQVWPADLSEGQEVAFAFIIGVFPIVGIQAIQSLIALPLRQLVHSLKKEHPLSDLDGLNIWYESRLLEEGIEDMQNLATANIVDVMLRTRVPVDRLVDWIDQAFLDLRVKDGTDDTSDRQILRRLGIRTATDLEDALEPTTQLDQNGRQPNPIEPDDFAEKMRIVLNQDTSIPSVTVSIWKTLAREPNLYHVRHWRETAKYLAQTSVGIDAVTPRVAPRSQPSEPERESLAR